MEFHQLRYVAALSLERHFLRAARSCNVSQPTLSQAVRKLEGELGRPLFERSPRRVELTAAGRAFLPHAERALEALRAARESLRGEDGEVSGLVKLGAIPTIGPYVMPEVLARLRRSAPKLKLELYEETTSVLLERLRAGRIDLALLSTPVPDKGLSCLVLAEEPFRVAVPRRHPLAARGGVSLERIHGERLLILQEGHCFSEQALEFCKMSRKDPHVSFEGSSLTSVLKMAAAGEGITLVPEMAVEPAAHPGLRFLPIRPVSPRRQIGLVWRVTMPLDRARSFVLETIQARVSGRKPRGSR